MKKNDKGYDIRVAVKIINKKACVMNCGINRCVVALKHALKSDN